MIDEVSIEIGGQTIDKHYGTWLNIWNELTQTSEKSSGYNDMIGNVGGMTDAKDGDDTLGDCATDAGAVQPDSRTKFNDAEPSGGLFQVLFHRFNRGVERFVPKA